MPGDPEAPKDKGDTKFGVALRSVSRAAPAPVPDLETRPEFSLISLRAVPPTARRRSSAMALRKPKQLGKGELVQVELLPSDMYGEKAQVTGDYGHVPQTAEVFGDDDDDAFIEAAEIEQVELNLEAEVGAHLNMDLSAECTPPGLAVPLKLTPRARAQNRPKTPDRARRCVL